MASYINIGRKKRYIAIAKKNNYKKKKDNKRKRIDKKIDKK